MVPVSPAILTDTVVPRSCSAAASASPSLVLGPSLIIAAVISASPRLGTGSAWLYPPENVIVKDTRGRSCFSETTSSAPFARGDRAQAGTCSIGAGPGGGGLG